MARHARVAGGLVAEIIEVDPGGAPFAERFHPDVVAACVEVPSGLAVAPGWRWTSGGGFAPPATPPAPSRIRVIRSLAFRDRLAAARQAELTAAAAAAAMPPASNGALLNFLLSQAASVTTDLDDPRTVGGVDALRAAGLITAAERAALLADGTAAEVA